MEREVDKFIDSIAKRVYPLTNDEKTCIEKFGKLIIKRGHLKKAIIETISKYDSKDAPPLLDSAAEQKESDS